MEEVLTGGGPSISSSPKSPRTRPGESAAGRSTAGPPPDRSSGPTLRIGVEPAGGTHRTTLSGDLDAGSVDVVGATVERLLRRDRPVVVVVDHLTSCDVAAVGALVPRARGRSTTGPAWDRWGPAPVSPGSARGGG